MIVSSGGCFGRLDRDSVAKGLDLTGRAAGMGVGGGAAGMGSPDHVGYVCVAGQRRGATYLSAIDPVLAYPPDDCGLTKLDAGSHLGYAFAVAYLVTCHGSTRGAGEGAFYGSRFSAAHWKPRDLSPVRLRFATSPALYPTVARPAHCLYYRGASSRLRTAS